MQSKQITVNGIKLWVETAGPAEAPLAILLHGFPETSQAWQRYIDPLVATGWRVAVPDQRGYGHSDKPSAVSDYVLDVLADDVCALAKALDAHKYAVIGHDWGGMVA